MKYQFKRVYRSVRAAIKCGHSPVATAEYYARHAPLQAVVAAVNAATSPDSELNYVYQAHYRRQFAATNQVRKEFGLLPIPKFIYKFSLNGGEKCQLI